MLHGQPSGDVGVTLQALIELRANRKPVAGRALQGAIERLVGPGERPR